MQPDRMSELREIVAKSSEGVVTLAKYCWWIARPTAARLPKPSSPRSAPSKPARLFLPTSPTLLSANTLPLLKTP